MDNQLVRQSDDSGMLDKLALAAFALFCSGGAFAADLDASAATGAITGEKPFLIGVVGSMIGIVVFMWIARKGMGIFGR